MRYPSPLGVILKAGIAPANAALTDSAVVLRKLYKLRKDLVLKIRLSSYFERPSCNLKRLLSPKNLGISSFQKVFNLLEDRNA